MNSSNSKRVFCVLLLFLVSVTFLLPAQAMGETKVLYLLSDVEAVTYIQNTPYLTARQKGGTLYGVFNTDGKQLIPCAYEDLYYLGFNCFGAVEKKPALEAKMPSSPDEINCKAIFTADGTRISDFQYGYLEVFSPYWACGWVLEKSTYNDFDYETENDFHYRIQRCDFFYLGDHALTGISGTEELTAPLSLSREEYKTAKGHGKYLYVQDRADQIKIYDSGSSLVNAEVETLDDPMYVILNYSVAARGAGGVLLDGFTSVQEVPTDGGMLLKASRLDYSGGKWSTVLNDEGEQLMPLIRGEIETVTRDYAVVNVKQKRGLYSFRDQKLLVPCAFDKVFFNSACLDPYVQHDFVYVEKGVTRYYYRITDGMMYELALPGNNWEKLGSVYVLNDGVNSRYRIYAPDQIIANVKDARIVDGQNAGSGYLLSFLSNHYMHVLISWRGEFVLKTYINPFTITNDDKAIVQKKDGTYMLVAVVIVE